jgi:TonB family protein
MPLNVRRFYTSVLLVLLISAVSASAQTVPTATPYIAPAPTAADLMRDRISRSKAYIAVRNYNAAIIELEKLRRETSDEAVQGVVNVLLMNSYLEQGDFKRAQEMLTEFFAIQKTTKPNAVATYMTVAGQVVKGARSRAERYKVLGLNIADRTLPLEALNDLEKMRETLELVIAQSKEIGGDPVKAANAMVMLEEASGSRSMLARDDYDSRRWRDEVADTREKMAKTGSVVTAVIDSPVADVPTTSIPSDTAIAKNTAANVPASGSSPVINQPVALTQPGNTNSQTNTARVEPPKTEPVKQPEPIYVRSAPPTPKESVKSETAASEPKVPAENIAKPALPPTTGPIDVGSLISYATTRSQPVYPQAAKTVRTTGVVKVEVTVNEAGEVAEVQKTSGPPMLQSAAKDAIKKWRFKPFMRDGQPVKATGFVSFNFSL